MNDIERPDCSFAGYDDYHRDPDEYQYNDNDTLLKADIDLKIEKESSHKGLVKKHR